MGAKERDARSKEEMISKMGIDPVEAKRREVKKNQAIVALMLKYLCNVDVAADMQRDDLVKIAEMLCKNERVRHDMKKEVQGLFGEYEFETHQPLPEEDRRNSTSDQDLILGRLSMAMDEADLEIF